MHKVKWSAILTVTGKRLYSVKNFQTTVGVKKFAGSNFCGFNPTEVFMDILSCFLARSAYYLRVALIYSQENFCGALESCESLAQRIFLCLQYINFSLSLSCCHVYLLPCISINPSTAFISWLLCCSLLHLNSFHNHAFWLVNLEGAILSDCMQNWSN